jgi:adenosylcobinamide kinase/adenosylcobinamide-phosphate guanylyltransferase
VIHLLTGGARAGKSTMALQLAEARPGPLAFIATATPSDDEMATRIRRHQEERGPRWRTWEAPRDVEAALHEAAAERPTVVLDCLTLWIANELWAAGDDDGAVERRIDALCACLPTLPAAVFLVSNEVGLVIVPDNGLARRYRDLLGRCNQRVAAVADHVSFVVAGLPLHLR